MDMFHTERRITIAIDTASKASIRDVGVCVPPCKHIWTLSAMLPVNRVATDGDSRTIEAIS